MILERIDCKTQRRTVLAPNRTAELACTDAWLDTRLHAVCRDDGSLAGYISIQSFSNNTAADTAHALSSLASEGAGSYILDLRGNPGGLVSAGLDVAGLLLRRDDVFCYVAHKDGISTPILIESEAPLTGAPLVRASRWLLC